MSRPQHDAHKRSPALGRRRGKQGLGGSKPLGESRQPMGDPDAQRRETKAAVGPAPHRRNAPRRRTRTLPQGLDPDPRPRHRMPVNRHHPTFRLHRRLQGQNRRASTLPSRKKTRRHRPHPGRSGRCTDDLVETLPTGRRPGPGLGFEPEETSRQRTTGLSIHDPTDMGTSRGQEDGRLGFLLLLVFFQLSRVGGWDRNRPRPPPTIGGQEGDLAAGSTVRTEPS